ncbi:hypothetical protein PFISCL1PPCAC_19778, partial [Pristionchus fissidentatus]
RMVVEKYLSSSIRNIVSMFTSHLPSVEKSLVSQRIQSLLEYTVGDGKNSRGTLVLSSFDAIGGSKERRECALRAATSIEILQSFLLVADDIMDESERRRGKPCWYRLDGIGLSAVNDALLLQVAAQSEMSEAFKGHPNKDRALSALDLTIRRTIVGQMMDTNTAGKVEEFSWQRYSQLVEHKTSHYTFALPIQLGVLASGMDREMKKEMEIAMRIGYLFQSQDDWLDVYGDTAVTGKIGTDIKDKKCTWLSCKALEILSKEKDGMEVLKSALNDNNEESVKKIYEDLGLNNRFKKFEDEFSSLLLRDIDSIPTHQLISVFRDLVNRIKHRQK